MPKLFSDLTCSALCALALFLPVESVFAASDLNTNITCGLNLSSCQLCGPGNATIHITHPGNNRDLTTLTVTPNLDSSGLTCVAGNTSSLASNGQGTGRSGRGEVVLWP